MQTQEILDPQRWAENTFGHAQLKDMRRTRRAVMAAARMAEESAASLPTQAQTWKETKAVYRLLDESDVTFDALLQSHWHQTRQRMETMALVLLVQETTDLDFTHRRKMSGVPRNRRWEGSWDVPANRPSRRADQPRGAGVRLSTAFHARRCPQG